MAPLTADRPRPEAVLSHSASHLVSLDELAVIPAGERMGAHHRPVPHIELVSAVKQPSSDHGYAVARAVFGEPQKRASLRDPGPDAHHRCPAGGGSGGRDGVSRRG